MQKIQLEGPLGRSVISIGEGLERLPQYLPARRTVIVTDSNVAQLYGSSFPDCDVIVIGTGEGIKTLETVATIYERLLQYDADRSTFMVGVGGGIVCDITGFAASTYLRGVDFGFVASTLLCQVDASVGGKNGVNFQGYKNMVGVFNAPQFVLCDLGLLRTLPARDLACGFAEIVKHAAIGNVDLFTRLEKDSTEARKLRDGVLEAILYDALQVKVGIVARDATEQGERRKLNFGHTLGHALEKVLGVPHGEAVSAGMVFAAELSVRKGLLKAAESRRLADLLSRFDLPVHLPCEAAALVDAMAKDKKRHQNHIKFVLLNGLGHAIVQDISLSELNDAISGATAPPE